MQQASQVGHAWHLLGSPRPCWKWHASLAIQQHPSSFWEQHACGCLLLHCTDNSTIMLAEMVSTAHLDRYENDQGYQHSCHKQLLPITQKQPEQPLCTAHYWSGLHITNRLESCWATHLVCRPASHDCRPEQRPEALFSWRIFAREVSPLKLHRGFQVGQLGFQDRDRVHFRVLW